MAINFEPINFESTCTSEQLECSTDFMLNTYGNYWGVWESLLGVIFFIGMYFFIKFCLSKIFNIKKYSDDDLRKKVTIRKIKKISLFIKILFSVVFLIIVFFNYVIIDQYCNKRAGEQCTDNSVSTKLKKPVIYLYPETTQEVLVQLDFNGEIIADYPEYNYELGGWKVLASPDSTLINSDDGREYQSLFWEGEPRNPIDWELNTGFIVEGKDVRGFLQDKLEYMGLTAKEYNEFILFWNPLMMDNKYNLVHFSTDQYTNEAPLKIIPEPDSMLRVFMITKALDEKIEIIPQELEQFERTGFSVVEWGGSDIK